MKSMLLSSSVFLLAVSAAASSALTNLADTNAAWECFADYTNNTLRIASVDDTEWDVSRRVDRLPFDMPFQLVVGPDAADRAAAEAALTTVSTSMPAHIRAYYSKHHLMAPLQQWLIRRSRPGITNVDQYVTSAAHPNVWQAKDFDLKRLAVVAGNLASNDVPILADLYPVYEGYRQSPIKRAEPFVDYFDPRPEETYATPFGAAIVLRAPEGRRKFRFVAAGWPFNDRNVNFKWVSKGGVSISHFQGQREKFPLERGHGEIVLDWSGGAMRRDVLVFARYGTDLWGPPTVISFYRIPNERRQYDKDGRIVSVEYQPAKDVIPLLYQNKPWKDVFTRDSLGTIVGFLRTRTGQAKDEEPFSILGERILESYAGDLPRVTAKVRYFTRKDDPTTLDYLVTKETVRHSQKPIIPRVRGEFPIQRKKRK